MDLIGKIKEIHYLEANFWKPHDKIEDIFSPLSALPHSVLLLSGSESDCSNYSFIGLDPYLVVRSYGDKILLENGDGSLVGKITGNPFDEVQKILECLGSHISTDRVPFYVGAMGYLGYDLRYQLERLPDISPCDVDLPDLYLVFPSIIVCQEKRSGKYAVAVVEADGIGLARECVTEKIEMLVQATKNWSNYLERLPAPISKNAYSSSFTKKEYIQAIEKTRDYIKRGHIYQVNISQRFTFPFKGSEYVLFRKLFRNNPASFYAYLNCKDFTVISTSPERFIFRKGDYIETRPIKGTRPRGKTPQEDEELRKELIESPKEDAELSMIVDLLRNDLGKICLPGTVKVKEHKRIEAYHNVFHLVSIVEGKLPCRYKHFDILKAMFPGGSITGCPKIRAMEIIEEIEPVKRGIYTGSIGYFGFSDSMDLNIAIRTAVRKGNNLYLSVGGGIVYGSEPEAEYMETIHKGETFLRLLDQRA